MSEGHPAEKHARPKTDGSGENQTDDDPNHGKSRFREGMCVSARRIIQPQKLENWPLYKDSMKTSLRCLVKPFFPLQTPVSVNRAELRLN
jgi:hypothetical protein